MIFSNSPGPSPLAPRDGEAQPDSPAQGPSLERQANGEATDTPTSTSAAAVPAPAPAPSSADAAAAGAAPATQPVSAAVVKFHSCRWRSEQTPGVTSYCTHRDVLPFAGMHSFNADAWCPDCAFYKLRRIARKRPEHYNPDFNR